MRVAVLGGGTMSPGIAAAFASRGHGVVVWGRAAERAAAAAERARDLSRFLGENELAPEAESAGQRIDSTAELANVADVDIVIEAIAEDLLAKRELLARVEEVCRGDTLIATNTSGLRVTDIARDLSLPERFVAMHFWNPAHLIPLVEVAGGERGSAGSVQYAVEVARSIGKLPVVLEKEVLGFLGTRMQQAVVREAIALFEAGVASAADIDLAVRASFGMRFPVLGPLETTDLSGLDVIGSIHGYLLQDLSAARTPQRALRERVERGDLGVKSGRGFHDWSERDPDALIRERDAELVRRIRLLGDQGVLGESGAPAA